PRRPRPGPHDPRRQDAAEGEGRPAPLDGQPARALGLPRERRGLLRGRRRLPAHRGRQRAAARPAEYARAAELAHGVRAGDRAGQGNARPAAARAGGGGAGRCAREGEDVAMSPRHRRLLPWFALLVIYMVWGSTYLAIRIAVREVPPMAAACLRFFASGVAMAVLAAIVDRKHGFPRWRQIADYALVGVLLLSIGNALVMWAEKTIPSGIAALIVGPPPLGL